MSKNTEKKIEQAIDLLRKNDYVVKVIKNSPRKCTALFPQPKFTKPQISAQQVVYNLNDEGLVIQPVDGDSEIWNVPPYALRLLVMSDIVRRMKRIPIHQSLITFYNEAGDSLEALTEVLAPPNSEDEVKKEGFLSKLVAEAIEDKFIGKYDEVAENHHVNLGYRMIKSCLI